MTEETRRVTIFGWRSINTSVKWLGTPVPFYDITGVPWTENILVPELCWGDRGNYKLGLCKLNLEFILEEDASLGVAPFFPSCLPSQESGKYVGDCTPHP